jgi:hypothetical protein
MGIGKKGHCKSSRYSDSSGEAKAIITIIVAYGQEEDLQSTNASENDPEQSATG